MGKEGVIGGGQVHGGGRVSRPAVEGARGGLRGAHNAVARVTDHTHLRQ